MNEQILRIKLWGKYLLSKKTEKYTNIQGKKIVIALAADYGNLGDVAITYAQKKFLQKHFPEYSVVEFPISETFTEIKSLKSNIKEDDIITIVGGGNIGDMYDDIEYCRQFIIRQFPKNKIVIFPQTIDFSDTERGRRDLALCAKIYARHNNLVLCVREEASYKRYKDQFNNEMLLTPDIVMSVAIDKAHQKREGILVSFRNDKETLISAKLKHKMLSNFQQEKVTQLDTHIGVTRLTLEGLYKKLNELWAEFCRHEVVLTDRLHGMIFSYITKTPCIVLPNNNHKISSCFKWIKSVQYIRIITKEEFADEVFMLQLIDEMRCKNQLCLETLNLSEEFDKIVNAIKR